MELRTYWSIVRKRFWLVLGLLAISLASYLLFAPRPPISYTATMRFVVGLRPEPSNGTYYTYDRYYTWLTAEYLLDDLAEIVKSRAFVHDVASTAGLDLPPGIIQGATSAGKLHRILSVTINWHDPEELARIADALVSVLREQGATYFAQLSADSAVVSLIDPPSINRAGVPLRQRLDLPLRLALALIAGIGLAFLLDYLDVTVRNRTDLEELGLPILAEIPSRRRWPFPFRRHPSP